MNSSVETTNAGLTRPLSAADLLEAGPDQSAIAAVLRPFAAVSYAYFGLDTLGMDQRRTRWRELAIRLDRSGASAAAIAALTERVKAAKQGPGTLCLFVSDDGTLLNEHHVADASVPDDAGHSAPANVIPLLSHEQQCPPYVFVAADRAGADVTACAGADSSPSTRRVVGPDDEIERSGPGGWSQPRFQQRAEDSWKHNSGRAAEAAAAAIAEVGGQVLVVSGDVRAVQYLTEQMPNDLRVMVRHITGSRAGDGSQPGRRHQVESAVREAAHAQTEALLAHLHSSLGPGGFGVQGRDATLEALAAGRVAMLLVTDPGPDGPAVWFGEGATEVYTDQATAVLSQASVRSGRLDDVAARSVLLANGRVRVIAAGMPGEPLDGIGGICRYAL